MKTKHTNINRMQVRLSKVDDVKRFNQVCANFSCDIDASIDKYVVDAKSILGLLSLNYPKNISIEVHTDNENVLNAFLNQISEWVVQNEVEG